MKRFPFWIVTASVIGVICLCLWAASGNKVSIHEAVRGGDLQQVREILSEDPEAANARDETGRTPLHLAAEMSNSTAAIELLIRHGADVNARDQEGYTPFLILMYNPQPSASVEIAGVLLEHGADPGATLTTGPEAQVGALQLAGDAGNQAICDLLLERGLELDLHTAIKLARTDDVRRMLRSDPQLVVATEGADVLLSEFVTMLEYRLLAPVQEPGRYLLEELDDPDLFAQIIAENVDIIDLLFEQDVPLAQSDIALLEAVQMPHHGVAEALLKNGTPVCAHYNNLAGYLLGFALTERTRELLCEYGADERTADQEKVNLAITRLIRELNRENVTYRMYAVRTLSMYGPQAQLAIPALRAALNDGDERVRSMAAAALERIETDPAGADR